MRILHRLVMLLGVVAMVLVGCSDGDDDTAATADQSGGAEGDTGTTDGGAEEMATDATVAPLPEGQPILSTRSIIATSQVSLVVEDAQEAARDVGTAATDAGGFVAEQEARVQDGEVTMTLRVPSSEHERAVGDVTALGEVIEQRLDTRDVTEQVIDLDSRIESAQTSVDRMRGFLDRTEDVTQLAAIESELASREAALESLLGRRAVLEDQVSLSTIHVELTEDPPEAELAGFGGGLRRGWDGFVVAGSVIVTGLGYALPFLVAAALVAGVWSITRRRVATRRT